MDNNLTSLTSYRAQLNDQLHRAYANRNRKDVARTLDELCKVEAAIAKLS